MPLVVLPTKPADYSHVKAKVYSGRKHSDTAGVVANTRRVSVRVANIASCYSDLRVDKGVSVVMYR